MNLAINPNFEIQLCCFFQEMLLQIAQHVQQFLHANNKPPAKSFYEEMMLNKRKQEEQKEEEQRKELERLKKTEEKEVCRLRQKDRGRGGM